MLSKFLVKKLLSFFDKNEKKEMCNLFFIIAFQGLCEVVGVVSIVPFMAIASNPTLINSNQKLSYLYSKLGFSSESKFLISFGMFLLIFFLINNLFSMYSTSRILRFVSSKNRSMSLRVFQSYLLKPYKFYLQKNSSDLIKNILVECIALCEGVILPTMQALARFFTTALICLILLIVDPVLAAFVGFVFISSYSFIYFFFYKKLGQYGRDRLEMGRKRFILANEVFSGIKEVKAFGCELSFIKNFSEITKSFSDSVVKNQLVQQLPRYLLEVIAFGSMLLATLFLIKTKENFSQVVPILALYALAGYRLMPNLQQLYLALTTIRFNEEVVDVIYSSMNQLEDSNVLRDPDKNFSWRRLKFNSEIKLVDVSFVYEKSDRVALNNLNIVIRKNSSVAFVGQTGAGKTTLVDLILGLLRPTQGEIFLDERKISNEDVRSWQKLVGYIPQKIFLCDGSIASNIAFGVSKDEVNWGAMEEASKIANLHDFVMNELPEGYETVVGERGIRLSGGQCQRIGIARALYTNPEILILDEATSSLDMITESIVVDAMKKLANKKTIIMVAHRLTAVKNCDQIFFLENGRVVDQGTFSELAKKSGKFKLMLEIDNKGIEE